MTYVTLLAIIAIVLGLGLIAISHPLMAGILAMFIGCAILIMAYLDKFV